MRLVPQSNLPAGAVLLAPLLFILLLLPTVAVGGSSLPPCSNVQSKAPRGNCQGTFTSTNGDKYVGEFKDSKPNGQGTFTFADGDKYVGEFKDGDQNGQGTFTSTNGDKYVGEYKNGERNGQGTSTRANGDKYVGEFKGGKPNGQGSYIGVNGDKYVGEFKDSKPNGQGTFTSTDGDKYVGEFKDNQHYGQGTLTLADGSKYVGEFKDGKENGLGTLTGVNGSIISAGIWFDGRFVGADLIAGMNVSFGLAEPNGSGVGVISGAVTNRNEIAVQGISVRCVGYLNSGRSIETGFMIMSVIEPGASAQFSTDIKGFSDRAVAKCWVVYLTGANPVRRKTERLGPAPSSSDPSLTYTADELAAAFNKAAVDRNSGLRAGKKSCYDLKKGGIECEFKISERFSLMVESNDSSGKAREVNIFGGAPDGVDTVLMSSCSLLVEITSPELAIGRVELALDMLTAASHSGQIVEKRVGNVEYSLEMNLLSMVIFSAEANLMPANGSFMRRSGTYLLLLFR